MGKEMKPLGSSEESKDTIPQLWMFFYAQVGRANSLYMVSSADVNFSRCIFQKQELVEFSPFISLAVVAG
jgi:hypothetical protein